MYLRCKTQKGPDTKAKSSYLGQNMSKTMTKLIKYAKIFLC